MAASLQLRPQNRDLGMMVRDVDEDLAIYLGARSVEEETISDHLLSEDLDDPKELGLVKTATDNGLLLLSLEADKKGDDGWLLTQGNLSAMEAKGQDPTVVIDEASSAEAAISLKSEQLGNTCDESDSSGSKPQADKRPSSSSGSRKPNSQSATPSNARRSLLPAKPKPSRPSTPTSRATLLPSSKPTKAVQTRSSTPNKAAATSSRPSAQAARTSLASVSKSSSRSSTPTRKTSLPSSESNSSSNGPKAAMSKSQTVVKSRPSLDTLSKSHNGSQSLKTSLPKRPLSASRARPSPTNTSSSSNVNLRQKSCSRAKTRAPAALSGNNKTISMAMLSRSRGYGNDGEDVNPVVMGTKMVERVVNMRKLAPPKQDECVYNEKPKKPSKDNSGFGRSLSNKSLDMALRHMDIRRTMPENLRPVATSSANGAKTRGAKSDTTTAHDVSGSPLTSSGSDSSKYSVDSSKSSIYRFLNGGSEMDQSSSYEI